MKPKVLVISSYPAPYRVGVFKELSKSYETEIYFDTCSNENRSPEWFCKSNEFHFEILDNQESIDHFKKALKQIKKYDFVIAYDPTLKPAMRAIFLCRLKRIPYFVNNDGAIIRKNFIRDHIKKFLYRGATACFSSGRSATAYYRYYGIDSSKIFEHKFTSLDEKDILKSPISDEEKKDLRKQLNLPDKVTFISIGQFIPRKGFDVLIKAWEKIGDDAHLLIIGGGDERASYEQYINEHNIKGITIIDFMPKDELFKYYCASDVFVLPTREDIWGLVVNEAMAVGLPVITTDNCVAGLELIENDLNGYIVPVEDYNELSDKMLLLLNNNDLRKKIAINNLNKISGWTIEEIAKRHVEAINQTLRLK